MKCAWIARHRDSYPVDLMCRLLDVARSGFFAWLQGKPASPRKAEDAQLLVAIKAAHERGRGSYGPIKIQEELAEQDLRAGINRIKRLRKLHGIRCKQKRKFEATTDSRHTLPIAPNRLEQRFNDTTAPNQVWVADITYIATDEGWLYLAGIKDLHTCKLVGWALDSRMTKQLALDALRMAYWREKPPPGLIHHSDRGSQYCSHAYQAALQSYGMLASMSRKGNCWDNAPMESFFATLKIECVYHYRFATREEAKRTIFEYVEVFYNRIRRHAKLGNISPAAFEMAFYSRRQQAA